jgi:hypothetical protein
MYEPPIPVLIAALTGLVGLATAIIHYRAARLSTRGGSVGLPVPLDGALDPVRAPAVRASLPSPPSRFVNRQAELETAMARIRAGHAAVAIDGEWGVGKSTTARELVHRLRDDDRRDDGMPDLRNHTFLWVACDNRCPALSDICASLGKLTHDQLLSTAASDQKLDALRMHMSMHKTVLVLDNLRLSDDPDSDALRRLVAAVPDGSLVVASIDRPHELSASRVTLEDLDQPHVVELIRDQVDALDLQPAQDFDERLAARLRASVGGNPGQIEWFLRSFSLSHRSLEEHLAAVERGEASEDRVPALWSDLAPRARTVLAACALLEGNAIAAQLAVACDLTDEALSATLAELFAVGLTIPVHHTDRPSTYDCPRAIGNFALSHSDDATMDAFVDRLVAQLERHFADHPEDAPAATPYVGSLRPLMHRLAERGDDATVQMLLRRSLDILFTLGLFDHRIELGRIAYESAIATGNHEGASRATQVLSSTHAWRGELDRAREAVAWGLLAAERSGDPAERARQMRCAGLVHYRARDAAGALRAIDGADRLARESEDWECVVNVLGLRAAAARYVGDLERSRLAAAECLETCERMPWFRAIAYPLRDLAQIALHEGNLELAREQLERARSIATSCEDRRQLARIALAEARMRLFAGELDAARETASEAQSAAARLGLPPEATEAHAIYDAARRARVLPPLRLYYAWRRPLRLTAEPT